MLRVGGVRSAGIRGLVVLAASLLAASLAAPAAVAAPSDTVGQTTAQQRIVPGAPGAYRFLQLGAGEAYTVREELGAAGAGRASARTSLVYFGQLSDFQLADEESPARSRSSTRYPPR
jgi:hypothetical protein